MCISISISGHDAIEVTRWVSELWSSRNTERRYYAYAPDLVIRSSLLFVNINQINQCKLIDGKKVKVNIVIYRFVSVLGMWFTVVVCWSLGNQHVHGISVTVLGFFVFKRVWLWGYLYDYGVLFNISMTIWYRELICQFLFLGHSWRCLIVMIF